MSNNEYPYVFCPRTGEDCTRCTTSLSTYIVNRMFGEKPGLPKQKIALVETAIKQIKVIQETERRDGDADAVDCQQRIERVKEEGFELTVRDMPEFAEYPLMFVVPAPVIRN